MLKLGPNGGRKVAEALLTMAACAKALCQNEHVYPRRHKGLHGWAQRKMGMVVCIGSGS